MMHQKIPAHFSRPAAEKENTNKTGMSCCLETCAGAKRISDKSLRVKKQSWTRVQVFGNSFQFGYMHGWSCDWTLHIQCGYVGHPKASSMPPCCWSEPNSGCGRGTDDVSCVSSTQALQVVYRACTRLITVCFMLMWTNKWDTILKWANTTKKTMEKIIKSHHWEHLYGWLIWRLFSWQVYRP